jgi:hypothetical protein
MTHPTEDDEDLCDCQMHDTAEIWALLHCLSDGQVWLEHHYAPALVGRRELVGQRHLQDLDVIRFGGEGVRMGEVMSSVPPRFFIFRNARQGEAEVQAAISNACRINCLYVRS